MLNGWIFWKVAEGEEGGGGSRCTVRVLFWNIHWYVGPAEMMGNAWVGRWRWGTMCSGGSLLLGIYGCDGGIHLLLWLQWMPLGDWATGVGQHVGPVFQPGPRGLASHQDLPDGIVLANLVIIQHCDHCLDFLWKWQRNNYNKVQNATTTTRIWGVGCCWVHSKIRKFSFHRKRFFNAGVLQVMVHNAQCLGGQWSHCRDWCWRPEGSLCGWWDLWKPEIFCVLLASIFINITGFICWIFYCTLTFIFWSKNQFIFDGDFFFAKSIERKINTYITAFSKTLLFVVLYAHKDSTTFFFALKWHLS